jgi:hypothetical protein
MRRFLLGILHMVPMLESDHACSRCRTFHQLQESIYPDIGYHATKSREVYSQMEPSIVQVWWQHFTDYKT